MTKMSDGGENSKIALGRGLTPYAGDQSAVAEGMLEGLER